jgi:hypothetical protein
MMIDINTDLTIQKKAVAIELLQQSTLKHEDGWRAVITYKITFSDQSSEVISITKVGEDYNNFWTNFNNGAYLFQVISESIGVEFNLPDNFEDSFLNVIATEDITPLID